MTSQNLGAQVALLVVFMAIISGIEALAPLFSRFRSPNRTQVNLILTASVLGLNWIVATFAALLLPALRTREFGLFPLHRLPLTAEILLSIAALDFFTYLAHVAMHKVPVLWRFHRVHHSDSFVDVTTSYRFHPFETIWRLLWTFVPALALGVPWQGLVIYRLISATNGLFEHANIALSSGVDRALSLILVTPNMHKIHHSNAVRHTDSNYGNIFALYDRVFRTFTTTEHALDVKYGLKALEPGRAESLRALLQLPFDKSAMARGARA